MNKVVKFMTSTQFLAGVAGAVAAAFAVPAVRNAVAQAGLPVPTIATDVAVLAGTAVLASQRGVLGSAGYGMAIGSAVGMLSSAGIAAAPTGGHDNTGSGGGGVYFPGLG